MDKEGYCSKHKRAATYCNACCEEIVERKLKAERNRYEAAVKKVLDPLMISRAGETFNTDTVMATIKKHLEDER